LIHEEHTHDTFDEREGLRAIVRAAIHPGIGVARVGDSPSEFFVGPELLHPTPVHGGYRDASGALKRQAAQFRIYGYDAHGDVVAELTAENARIRWTAHLANKKSAWYKYVGVMELPDSSPTPRRNPNFIGPRRRDLVIDTDCASWEAAACRAHHSLTTQYRTSSITKGGMTTSLMVQWRLTCG
jgi:hypothetical protein